MHMWIYYGRRYVVMQTRYHQVRLTMSMANPLLWPPCGPLHSTGFHTKGGPWLLPAVGWDPRAGKSGNEGPMLGKSWAELDPQFWEYPTLGTSLNIKERLAQSFFLTTYTKKAQQRHQSSSARQKRTYYALPKGQIYNGNTNIFHVTFVEGMNSVRFLHHVHVRACSFWIPTSKRCSSEH